jgi:hypothetical protein
VVRFVSCPPGKKVLGGGYVVYSAVGRWVAGVALILIMQQPELRDDAVRA